MVLTKVHHEHDRCEDVDSKLEECKEERIAERGQRKRKPRREPGKYKSECKCVNFDRGMEVIQDHMSVVVGSCAWVDMILR